MVAQPSFGHRGVVQRMWDESMDESEEDSGDDYFEPEKKGDKQQRFGFLTKTPRNVTKSTGHQVKHFDQNRFDNVWTCRICHRMLAYEENGVFKLSQYGYLSKKKKKFHQQRSLELDHYPPWAPRLSSLEKQGATFDEMRTDYQDESRLRALCRVCNGSHKYEKKKTLPDYDSSDDDFDPPQTPKHETQYNSGQFSGYYDSNWLSNVTT